MKAIYLILVFTCFSISGYAQLSLLGKNENDVLAQAPSEKFILNNRSVKRLGADSVVILTFFPNNPDDTVTNFTKTFFIRNEVCKSYMLTYFIKELPNFIQAINSKYKRIDDTHWIDNNAYYQGTLVISKDTFSMSFEKL